MFKAWYIYLNKITFDSTDVFTVPLWYNPQIFMENISLPHWYQVGIITSLDIMKINGTVLSIVELRQTFGLTTNFLEHHCLERITKKLLEQANPNTCTTSALDHT